MANYPFSITKTRGYNLNFYQKLAVTWSTFGGGSTDGVSPDMVIRFPTQSVMMLNEGTASTQVLEYSFNGNSIDGELDPSLPTRGLVFDNRVICLIWFRVKAGSTSSIARVDAWSVR